MEAQTAEQPRRRREKIAYKNPSPSVVRVATPHDEEDLMELMREASDEQALFRMSETKSRAMLHHAFNRQGGMVGVIGEVGAIEAALYMLIAQPLYSEDWHLEEIYQFVRAPFRRSGHAKALIDFAKKCHRDLHIPVLMGVLHNKHTEAKIRLYRRHLGVPVGAFFLFGHPGYGEAPSE